jgi:TolB-like protein/Tfp pilus assembly protein PilF
MAPEQLEGKEVDARTDIFAFGAVMYEMATGRKAFEGQTQTSLISAILSCTPPPVSAFQPMTPPALDRLVRKCLAKDREKRWQTASDLSDELKWIARGGSESAGAPVAASKPLKTGWRHPAAVAAAVAILVALALLLAVLNPGGWRDRLLGGVAPGQIQSLAVLPLENLSGDPQQEYFADGMTEALITSLAKIGSLKVISRTSVLSYKDTQKPLPEIARELNVDAVVEGSVIASGDQVRITAQLIEARNDQHLWAESYQRNLSDILALQDEVARTIAREIRANMTPQEQTLLTSTRTVNPQAHEAYLRGLYHNSRLGERAQAREAFNRAIQLDSDYAPPYAGLAGTYFIPAFFETVSPRGAYSAMKDAASKALQRDETLAEAHSALALARLHADWDWAGAEREFKRALELNPSHADVHHSYAHFLMAMGREDESFAESRRAVELDPVDAGLTGCLGWHDVWAGEYDQAIQHALGSLGMNPNVAFAKVNLGWAYEQKSMFEEAIAQFQAAVPNPVFGPMAMTNLGHVYAVSGQRQQALEMLARLKQRSAQGYVSPYQVAAIHAGLGEKDLAFEWLEKAYAERASWMVHIKWDPRLANLRSDPRFQDLVRRVGLPS